MLRAVKRMIALWPRLAERSRRPRSSQSSVSRLVESLEARRLMTVQFVFNYSLDTNHFFDTQAKKDLLELAGHMLGDRLNDSLSAIAPSGTNKWTPSILNPATGASMNLPGTTSVGTNQILVYVGCRTLGGAELGQASSGGFSSSGTTAWNATVKGRGQAGALASPATDTAVWGGSISFDSKALFSFNKTTASLTNSAADFLPVALHELEHVLGFASFNPAFSNLTTAAGTFVGAASKALNGGVALPLSPDRSHFKEGTLNDGIETVMDPTLTLGTRKFAGNLDFAALTDIGWQVGGQDDTITTGAQKFTDLGTAKPVTISTSIEAAKDVDLYRIYISAGLKVSAAATPAAGLDTTVRIFDVAGNQLNLSNQGTAGKVDAATFVAPRTDYYYVGISSTGNSTYNPNVAGSGAGGQTGAYSLTLSAVNTAPVLSTGSQLAYTENQAATVINAAIAVSDIDNTTLASATVAITNFVTGQDVLSFTNVPSSMGNIAGVFNSSTGVLTLTSTGSSATLTQWQTALRAVKYNNSSDNPTITTRSVTFAVDDGQALNHVGNAVTSTITITALNDAPVLAGTNTLAYTENQVATLINPTLAVTDPDSSKLASATVTLSSFVVGKDVLGFTAVPATMGNIVGTVNNSTGVIAFSSTGATATLGQWQTALRAVTYFNSSDNPAIATRTVKFSVDDGQSVSHASNVISSAITIKAVNDAPRLTGIEPTALTYKANSAAAVISIGITVTDVDNATLAGATIQITGNYQNGQDLLGFVNTAKITGGFNAATGTLTLTGTDTVANYQAALKSITYRDSLAKPNLLTRTITFKVTDGALTSVGVSRNIAVTA